MFGVKLKLWMETHLGKRRVRSEQDNSGGGGAAAAEKIGVLSPTDSRRESKISTLSKTDEENGSVSVSASASTSILLGSFTQSLSSPDTGYSTDGYSPKNGYPALSTKSSSYALSSLLSTHLFKRSSQPIGPLGSTEEFPVSDSKGIGLCHSPAQQEHRSPRVNTNVDPQCPITPVRKSSLGKDESSASPHTSSKGASVDGGGNPWTDFPQTKSRTRIKTNPWLSIPSQDKSCKTKSEADEQHPEEIASLNGRSRCSVSCGIPELNRMSASTDSGQGTLDNQRNSYECSSYTIFDSPKAKDSFVSSEKESAKGSTGYPGMKIRSPSTTSTATNTPIPLSRLICNGKVQSQRRGSISEPKSEDGTTLVDLMGRFDDCSYQKMVDKETDILSDWANTDEDVDEDLLTPKGPASASPEPLPSLYPRATVYPAPVDLHMGASPRSYASRIPVEINFNLPTNCFEPQPQPAFLPDPYDTLLLGGKSNLGPHSVSHVHSQAFFPVPGMYSNDPILNRKKIFNSQSSKSTHSKIARGALGLLRKLFRKPSAGRRDRVRETTVLPDCNFPTQVCSRILPCSPAPSKSFLTPTPNSFRRKAEDSRPPSVQKGVKIDVIRLPSTETNAPSITTPVFGSKWQERPGQVSHSGMEYQTPNFGVRNSPFLRHSTPTPMMPKTPSPAIFGLHRNSSTGGVPPPPERSPLPIPNFIGNTSTSNRIIGDPARFSKARLTSPSFNNYSPIHRLVVTSHQVPRGNIRSESISTSVRANNRPTPCASPLCVQHQHAEIGAASPIISRHPPYQYITSSNHNSPLLTNSKRAAPPPPPPPHMSIPPRGGGPLPPLRGIIKPPSTNNTNHYYSTPQKKINDFLINGSAKGNSNNSSWLATNGHTDRIYERVDGLDDISDDDGDGEGGDYECDLSLASSSQQSQSQSQSQSQRSVERERERKVHWPMSWGTSLSETESKLLEADTDRKYRRLISQAEALLKEIAMESNVVSNQLPLPPPPHPHHQQQHQYSNRKRSRFPPEDCPQSDPLQRKTYDCWALRRLQQELAGCCASPPVLHRSRVQLSPAVVDHGHHVSIVTHIPLVRNHSFLPGGD